MKWRGWDVGNRFKACGGNWGGAFKTKEDILRGGMGPDGRPYPPCPHAAGPFPYMSGGFNCMSRPLAQLLARDRDFGNFLSAARSRNDRGTRCTSRATCASQPDGVRMWHHEDAGIAFNLFNAVVRANATANLVPLPGHFDDPVPIERTRATNLTALDAYLSARAIFTHNVKKRADFEAVSARWNLSRPRATPALLRLNCSARGLAGFRWDWARLPCPPVVDGHAGATAALGRFCTVEPSAHFGCFAWSWLLPEVTQLILHVLSAASDRRLRFSALLPAMRDAQRAQMPWDIPGCRRDCLRFPLPGGAHLHRALRELADRGDVRYEPADVELRGRARYRRGLISVRVA
eukprot:101053-Prymnesium_polylepis.1